MAACTALFVDSSPSPCDSLLAGESTRNSAFSAERVAAAVSAVTLFFALASTVCAETVRIAFIDPLSGPFAPVGQQVLKEYQYVAELASSKGWAGNDVKFEMVPLDGKASPQESLTQLNSVIDQGIRY